jgi:hypothetical protein
MILLTCYSNPLIFLQPGTHSKFYLILILPVSQFLALKHDNFGRCLLRSERTPHSISLRPRRFWEDSWMYVYHQHYPMTQTASPWRWPLSWSNCRLCFRSVLLATLFCIQDMRPTAQAQTDVSTWILWFMILLSCPTNSFFKIVHVMTIIVILRIICFVLILHNILILIIYLIMTFFVKIPINNLLWFSLPQNFSH